MAELTVPKVDFSPLGNLGKIYKEAQNEQGMRDAFSQGIGSDPQSLASLAQRVAPYNPQLGVNLAQLAHSYTRQNAEDTRQAGLDTFNRNIELQKLDLAKRASARADEGPEETAAQRAAAAKSYGIDPATPQGKAYILTGQLPEASFQNTIEQRKQAAVANGLDPSSPGFQSFVLTGKMPREDAQPLTATDKKAILEADEMILSNQSAIDSLNRAKGLSKEAFAGPLAGKIGYATSFLGESSDLGKSGSKTLQLENEITSNALSSLKAIFGGAPTEGERKILLDIQGSTSKPDNVRQEIYNRAISLAQKRLEFNRKKAEELRGNTYYKPGQAKPQTESLQQGGVVDWRSYFGGGQ
jgi:hypothetical protein